MVISVKSYNDNILEIAVFWLKFTT